MALRVTFCFVMAGVASIAASGPEQAAVLQTLQDAVKPPPEMKLGKKARLDRPKIYIYDLPEKFNKAIPSSGGVNLEMTEFESEMETMIKRSRYHTKNVEEATFFYIPVHAVSHCAAIKFETNTQGCKESARLLLIEALDYVKTNHFDLWNRNEGRDHVVASPYDWSVCYATRKVDLVNANRPEQLGNVRVISFLGFNSEAAESDMANPGRCYQQGDVILPPYVPRSRRELLRGNSGIPRGTIAYLRTNVDWDNDGFKRAVVQMLASEPETIITGGRVDEQTYTSEIRSSLFCLVPPGFAPWSFRVSEAILGGCIPVFLKMQDVRVGCIDKSKVGLSMEAVPGKDLIAELKGMRSSPDKIAEFQSAIADFKGYAEYGAMTMECLIGQLIEAPNGNKS